jgi:transcriptional regulator with XRE-family HTH domain
MTSIELRVSEAVKNSHLTYSEIARQTGAESSAVSKWAKTGKISVIYLAKLCTALSINPSLILYGEVIEDSFDDHNRELFSLQRKAIYKIRHLKKEHYYKLEDLINNL